MNTRSYSILCAFWLLSVFSFPLFSQIEMKLQLMPDGDSWGVYVKPQSGIDPSTNTVTGSGQIVIISPNGFDIQNFESMSGHWGHSYSLDALPLNPNRAYHIFGLITSEPDYPITYRAGEETLFFKFEVTGVCPDTLYFINSEDPYVCPESLDNCIQPSELSVIDFGSGTEFYTFSDIYGHSAWNCRYSDFTPSTTDWPEFPSDGMDIPDDGDEDGIMLIAPNPAHGEIFVSIGQVAGQGKAAIRLLNLHGQTLDEQSVELENRMQFDLQKYPAGIYFLVLERDGKIESRSRFVKQ